MNTLLTYVLLIFSTFTRPYTHFDHALHPYIVPAGKEHYLATFDAPISGVYGESEGIYIYIYRFNQKNLSQFTLDISCPDKDINKFVHNLISDNATVTNKKISWQLDPDTQKQIVWFYTVQDRADRSYYLNDKAKETNKILGPSCKTMAAY